MYFALRYDYKPIGTRERNVVVWIKWFYRVIGADTTEKYDIVVLWAILWKERCHWVCFLRSQMSKLWLVFFSLLPQTLDPDLELSAAFPLIWLPACCQASHHDNNGLHLWPVSQPQWSAFLYESCNGSWRLFTPMKPQLRYYVNIFISIHDIF